MTANFSATIYRDNETGYCRWAVFDNVSRVFYFASRYGRKAADALAARLNRGS